MVAVPPVVAARWPSRASASFSACTSSARTRPASRKRTSVLAGCTLTSTSRGVERHEQRHHRMAVARQIVGIGAAHRADQQLVAHRAAVDEQILPERVGAAVASAAPAKPSTTTPSRSARDLDGVGAEVRAEHVAEPREPAGRARQRRRPGHRRALLAGEREGDVRPAHGEPPHHLAHRLGLGAVGLEELQPRRRRVEQVAHLDPGAFAERRRLDLRLRAGIDRRSPRRSARRRGAWRSRAAPPRRSRAAPRRGSRACGSASRSSPSSLEVAWRSTASARSARVMPSPSSVTRMSRRPPPSVDDLDAAWRRRRARSRPVP